jgi:mannose-6-phosphate isomerase-like protein (cupin superfamily)
MNRAVRISLADALSKLPLPATERWPEGVWDAEVLAHGSMSVILFTPRGTDYQTSHRQDEIYIVLKGAGMLFVEGTRYPFAAGDVLFVAANKLHRFEEFSPDLTTWAVFWGPQDGEAT